MQISFNGIKLIKSFEGFKADAYKDTGGVWTVGYGTIKWLGKPVVQGTRMTEAEAELALQADLAWAQSAVNQLVRVPLSQNQFDALVSLVYNIGEKQFTTSTLLRLLRQGQYLLAANQFDRWVFDNGVRVKGLENRRKQEKELFLTPTGIQ